MIFAYKNQLQIFITEHLQINKKYKQLKLSKIKLFKLSKFKIIVINKNLGKQFILQGDFIKYFEKKINDHENLEFKIQPKNFVFTETARASKLSVETYLCFI
jgi:hypothetical protein